MEDELHGGRPAIARNMGLLIAGAVALISAGAGLAAILLLGSGTPVSHKYTAAPSECVQAWNANAPARFLGRHQYGFHRYKQVEVLTLSTNGYEVPNGSPGGVCGIVFAASTLDPEFAAAAAIKKPAGWFPLSLSASANRLAQLQSDAKTAYNASLHEDGTLTPLPPP